MMAMHRELLARQGNNLPRSSCSKTVIDLPKKYRAAFDLCWRTMRDRYYDERLGNRNWDAIRRKYADMAEQSPDTETFATVVSLMLGELNGSHLGFLPGSRSPI